MQPCLGIAEALVAACTMVIWEGPDGVQEGRNRPLFWRPRLDFKPFSPSRLPVMTLVSIPANPVPEDVVSGTIKTPDGAELRFARWAPPAGRKGTVCVFTGRSEQIEKYFETVRDLRDRGFAVAMIDWRGQGHSSRRLRDPRKGYVRYFSDYELDVETFVQQVVLPDCPPPHFALAHSMGGAVMLRVAYAGKRWFDRMVLSAPMIDLPGRRTGLPVRAFLRLSRLAGQGGRYVPGGGDALTGTESFINNPFTSDPVR